MINQDQVARLYLLYKQIDDFLEEKHDEIDQILDPFMKSSDTMSKEELKHLVSVLPGGFYRAELRGLLYRKYGKD